METRANYVLIGAFTLAVVVGAFLFVMWVAGYGTAGGRKAYQVVFTGSVSGLSIGANVLFNGIKVGEVTHLTFSRSDPHQVVADINVNTAAPIDSKTKARLETQGFTGGAAVALLGASTKGAELVGENGRPPVIYAEQSMQIQDIIDNVAAVSVRATSVLDDADKLITDNSEPIRSAIANVDQFSKALADNSAGVDAALKSVGEIGKQIGPLAARLQTLSDHADQLVQSIDPDKIRAIVDNVQSLSAKGNSVVDRADKLLADNSNSIHSTLQNADAFAKTLAENGPNIDTTLKNLAEISKTVQPVVAQIQSLSENLDRVVKAVDPDKVHSIVDNVQSLSAKGKFSRRSRRQAARRQFRAAAFDAAERRRLRQDLGRERPQRRYDAEEPGRDQQDRPAGRGANPESHRERRSRGQGGRSGQGSRDRRQRAESVCEGKFGRRSRRQAARRQFRAAPFDA